MKQVNQSTLANPDPQVLKIFGIKGDIMPHKILIVEDHVDSRELLVDMLEFSDYEVIQAADGEEGEQLAFQHEPDMILLDISLPKKNGLDVARALRNQESTRDIPIIAFTAHARAEDEQKTLDAGCNAYIPKPVKPKEVLRQMEALLREKT